MLMQEGFVFRVRIVYPREVSLLKATTTPDGKLCYRDTPESLALERDYLHLPKLTGALHGWVNATHITLQPYDITSLLHTWILWYTVYLYPNQNLILKFVMDSLVFLSLDADNLIYSHETASGIRTNKALPKINQSVQCDM